MPKIHDLCDHGRVLAHSTTPGAMARCFGPSRDLRLDDVAARGNCADCEAQLVEVRALMRGRFSYFVELDVAAELVLECLGEYGTDGVNHMRAAATAGRLRRLGLELVGRGWSAITYACDRCDDEAPSACSICRHCEGTLTAVARIDAFSVEVAGELFCRGAETDQRIAEACALVDEVCRDDLEWLLRHGPSEDAEVTAPIVLAAIDRNSDVAPMSLIDCLRESLRVAAQESRADFRTKTLAMAQLGPGGGK